ncbi:MAG: hypothetical protein ACFFD2_15180 [Promethearchaeota archaeon]
MVISRENIGLGAEGIGVLNVGVVIFTISSLLIIGIKKSTSQKISENIINKKLALKEAKNGVFAIFIICIIIGIGFIITSFFIASPFTFQNSLSSILFIIGILMFVNLYREGIQSILSGIGKYNKIAKSNLYFFLFELISGISFIFLIRLLNLEIVLIFLCYVVGLGTQILILYIYIKPHRAFYPEVFRLHFREQRISKNVKDGALFAITEIIPLNILGSSSLFLLFAFTNFEISGAYSIVTGYSLAGLLVINFTWPLITHIANAYGRGDFEKIRYNLKLVVKIFFYVTFLIIVIFVGFSQGFILLFYGNSYLTGATDIWIPFMLIIIASSITAFEYIICCVLLGIGKRKPAAIYFGALFLLINGISVLLLWLNPFNLSPQINAALGYLIGAFIMLFTLPYLLKKEINQKIPFSIGIRCLIALLCTLAITILLVWPPLNLLPISNPFIFIFLIPILSLIYLILLVFFGSISESDLDLLEKKLVKHKLKKILPIVSFFRKIMRISPFCNSDTSFDE